MDLRTTVPSFTVPLPRNFINGFLLIRDDKFLTQIPALKILFRAIAPPTHTHNISNATWLFD